MSRRLSSCFFWVGLLAVAVCSVWGLLPRWRLERTDRTVAVLADYREILPMAQGAGLSVEEALSRLKERGLCGLMVSELTGDDVFLGMGWARLEPVNPGPGGERGTLISLLPAQQLSRISPQAAAYLSEWLPLRLTGKDGAGKIFLPVSVNMLKNIGILPDIDGLEIAKKLGLPVFYRPAQSLGWMTSGVAEMLRRVSAAYPVAVFAPAGEVVSGYPDVSVLADVSRELTLPLAQVEFSRQLGAPALNQRAAPLLLPLHSVTNEEMMARNITRSALRERLIRAAVERSVRLLLLRASPQNTGGFSFQSYEEEISALAQGLRNQNFALGWPRPVFRDGTWGFRLLPAWALSAVLLLMLWRCGVRMAGAPGSRTCGDGLSPALAAGLLGGSAALAFLILKVPAAARLAGALAAPMIATEASLMAMDYEGGRSFLSRLGGAVLTALAGGLAVAAFFSVPAYMQRLQTFSGVKLTLMLPPLLVLLHDLRRRIHPESLEDILSRPPLWGELMLCGVLLAGLLLVAVRSGNVSFGMASPLTPGFEARLRGALERWLIARPRSKEVFLGYPCLLLLGFLVKNGLWARYREVLRIGVSLGFSSVINSFCHFHTHLSLILLREFNGLWTGLLVGLILVAAVRWFLLPLLRRAHFLWE
ncbi:MAG: DUF5693 family protein [Fretibacterium sp.]|nr:DUF5693 family protein [Fretibacterium sp.]